MTFADFAFATTVEAKSVESLLEVNVGGRYRTVHPWYIAQEMLLAAQDEGLSVALLVATGEPGLFTHFTTIDQINVKRYTSGGTETELAFSPLVEINPIWEALDSVFLLPSAERVKRETVEQLRPARQAVTAHDLHPYAICESPPFLQLLGEADSAEG